jgi:hypothetical protein
VSIQAFGANRDSLTWHVASVAGFTAASGACAKQTTTRAARFRALADQIIGKPHESLSRSRRDYFGSACAEFLKRGDPVNVEGRLQSANTKIWTTTRALRSK